MLFSGENVYLRDLGSTHAPPSSIVPEPLTPKPPPKMPGYLTDVVKSDMQKTMELLKQRRLTQQRVEEVLELETESNESVEPEPGVTESVGSQLKSADTCHEESHYSPRIL